MRLVLFTLEGLAFATLVVIVSSFGRWEISPTVLMTIDQRLDDMVKYGTAAVLVSVGVAAFARRPYWLGKSGLPLRLKVALWVVTIGWLLFVIENLTERHVPARMNDQRFEGYVGRAWVVLDEASFQKVLRQNVRRHCIFVLFEISICIGAIPFVPRTNSKDDMPVTC